METNVNQYVHQVLQSHITPSTVAIDATCGNGHDTLFLANHCLHVHAFDIQAQAIQATKNKIPTKNVTFYHQSHDTFLTLFKPQSIDLIVYNLGYLPGTDHAITTTPQTTLTSLQQALDILSIHGLISLTIYIGHAGGKQEAETIENFLCTLDKHDYTIQKVTYFNRKQSPYVVFIQKEK
ncbi:tRNA (mnm(5)s(2)U34)-methyltransferase [Candidatus Xianfuyuplasma coldseepsis]|uniref:Methyltransferase domain-containing protein n=1 Tax=Candidatus Xianfuyuplasma coldseepsis TaxID=2782163 RepID=A0A7L7KNW4_9MOLU|nr:class I SAM-dependent methyltransferase [Xianfuyuplasma coldseepsis]QMS84215.1 methyltransferase domain-containing protein [Xianfuyuplasma coldseepsis]